jgi:hypothetical protein
VLSNEYTSYIGLVMVWRNSLSSNVDVAHTRQAPRKVYCLRTKYEANCIYSRRDEVRIIK